MKSAQGPSPIAIRSRIVVGLLLALTLLLAACSPTPEPPPPPPPDGLVTVDDWTDRQRDYLRQATETLDRRSPESILAALGRARSDDGFRIDAAEFTPADLQHRLDRIDRHVDTSDFDLMRLWLLWHAHGDELAPQTRAALEKRLLGFRYWYTDPLPPAANPRGDDRSEVDHKWFWSENHRLIVHTLEYLAGTTLPDQRFVITGEPGRTHAERGRTRLTAWLDEKARWGFSEWHSDVYYPENVQALLLLSEYAEDDLAERARALLDVLFLDFATAQVDGNFGTTHGRSYMKDKSRAADQNTRDIIHFLFDTNPHGYAPWVDFGALLLATSTSYRLPEVTRRIATEPAPSLTRQRMGIALDPNQPVADAPEPPPGTTFTDPDALAFWWDRGAMTAWQVVPLSMRAIREHELWRGDLFAPVAPLLRQPGTSTVEGAQHVSYALGCQINAGLLTEAHTVTYRAHGVALSSVQDYRAGCLGRQYHAWQATLGADAVVFTTHPGNADRGRWADDDLYWNGSATMPRTGQVGGVAINIYAPRFPAAGNQDPDANYQPFTHAFFPQQHFDEVREVGAWTLARKGDGYVALWSHRPTQWAPVGQNPAGLEEPYDLLAPGGANNVWITEVGTRERWGDFDAFVEAIGEAEVGAVDLGTLLGVPRGFVVRYQSPSEGTLTYATDGPLTKDDAPVDQRFTERLDSPWARVAAGEQVWTIRHGDAAFVIDLRTGDRRAG
ncbi:MAG: hypothetical protein Q4F67_07525 [Propionibacteriaceae bacterium]|nr:hypothetical protein [Propionibacteriaceae bacterium]